MCVCLGKGWGGGGGGRERERRVTKGAHVNEGGVNLVKR